MRKRTGTLLFAVWPSFWAGRAAAQAAAPPPPGLVQAAQAAIQQVGTSALDQLDIFWFEQGRVYFSVGRGKVFGIDLRAAMGNPAALRPTTQIKWENFLADFNSRIVLLASQYPALVFPEGVALDQNTVFAGIDPFSQLALEEQVDLAGYLFRTAFVPLSDEEQTIEAFQIAAYLGGTVAAVYLLSRSNVQLPLVVRLDEGTIRGRRYDVRLRSFVNQVGFAHGGYPDLSNRLALRAVDLAEVDLDFNWKQTGLFLNGRHPVDLNERALLDLRRYGTYYVGGDQAWNTVLDKTDFSYLIGAQVDVITPGRFQNDRYRTGVELNYRNGTSLPQRYLIDFYHKQSLFGGHNFDLSAQGSILVNNLDFQGVGGQIRGSYLVGSNVPKYSSAYSPEDWDRFARIYVLVSADTQQRLRNNYDARIVYAAPFDFDRAVERLIERLKGGDTVLQALDVQPPLGG